MELTGNPFVDTGLMVVTALAKRQRTSDLTFEDIRAVFGDGDQLARHNERLKCFTMVFGTNGPLTQAAYQKKRKNKELYVSIVKRFLDFAATEAGAGPRCDLTGIRTEFNFQTTCAQALRDAGLGVPEKKYLGRDWVPLGGSLGNDAQALPVASRPLHVSALALLALQYLPLGVRLFKGKLTCPQSTYEELVQAWVNNIVEDNQNRLRAGQTEILSVRGAVAAKYSRYLCSGAEEVSEVPGTEMRLWLFSNSGAGADCGTEEIPDRALRFIYRATARFGSEIRRLIGTEPKDSRQQLFECIREERDYPGLYPFKKQPGASPEFYEFYQREIRMANISGLAAARKLARFVLEGRRNA